MGDERAYLCKFDRGPGYRRKAYVDLEILSFKIARRTYRKIAEIPMVPEHCQHNAHIFYVKLQDKAQRSDCQAFLREKKDLRWIALRSASYSSPAGCDLAACMVRTAGRHAKVSDY